MTDVLILPARLDLGFVSALAAELVDRSGADIVIDAGKVEHMGALSAQLLIAAQQKWAGAGRRLTLSARSAAFDESLAVMGLAETLVTETSA